VTSTGPAPVEGLTTENAAVLRIDTFADLLLFERSTGYTERSIALIQVYLSPVTDEGSPFICNAARHCTQAMVDLHVMTPVCSNVNPEAVWKYKVADLEKFWESEFPRVGECTASGQSAGETLLSTWLLSNRYREVGMGSWIGAGRPLENGWSIGNGADPDALTGGCASTASGKAVVDFGWTLSLSLVGVEDGDDDAGVPEIQSSNKAAGVAAQERSNCRGGMEASAPSDRLKGLRGVWVEVEGKGGSEDEEVEEPSRGRDALDALAEVEVTETGRDGEDQNKKGGEAEEVKDDEEYVYSRVHGYKIKKIREDSGKTYKKILGELKVFTMAS